MIAPIGELQRLVGGRDSVSGTSRPGSDVFLARVGRAIQGLAHGGTTKGADLAGLIRQGIMRCHLRHGSDLELRVPSDKGWPAPSTWRSFGCEATRLGNDEFLIRVLEWRPEWCDALASEAVKSAISEEHRRVSRPAPADPLVNILTPYTTYASAGQREAVRAAFLAPSGSTVIVNLPTGGGKTLAFQLPSLAGALEGGVTVVVVPTTALALDQEERFRELLSHCPSSRVPSGVPLAYHGGMDPRQKQDHLEGIRDGIVPIVFASPEAALGPLRRSLFAAASEGRLCLFAIDEAHIVSQWGQQFRPEFQRLAGLRNALLEKCPPGRRFKTLLLTATLTSEAYETLRLFFGSDCCQLVGELELRPEPSFLLASPAKESDKHAIVEDALRFLPRPMIVYTTLREQAAYWHAHLHRGGYGRVALIRGGDLDTEAGRDVLKAWRERDVDIVVATSAFGMGVDQGDVRTVLHACLPETIDRYYQEVGRAGRDGNAAIAALISSPEDGKIAESMAREKLITAQRGHERWDAMWTARVSQSNGYATLSLDERPPNLPVISVENASWNLRTLVLMARAGLIEFGAEDAPRLEQGHDETAEEFEERRHATFEAYARQVSVRVLDDRGAAPGHWERSVSEVRDKLRASDDAGLKLVKELRSLRRPMNELFREVYGLPDLGVRPPRLAGNCPVTRREGTSSERSGGVELLPLRRVGGALAEGFLRALAMCADGTGRYWIAYEPVVGDPRAQRRLRDQVLRLIRHAIAAGVVEVSGVDEWVAPDDWKRLTVAAPLGLVMSPQLGEAPGDMATSIDGVARMSIVGSSKAHVLSLAAVMRVPRETHVIVVPRGLEDPVYGQRDVLSVRAHLSLDQVMARLSQ